MTEHLTKCADCVFWGKPAAHSFERCRRRTPRFDSDGDPEWVLTGEGDACGEGMTPEQWHARRAREQWDWQGVWPAAMGSGQGAKTATNTGPLDRALREERDRMAQQLFAYGTLLRETLQMIAMVPAETLPGLCSKPYKVINDALELLSEDERVSSLVELRQVLGMRDEAD